ncbi:MAG: hypothetical protein AB8B93_08805 [Pseudomonadales bacterium]
MMRTGFMLVLLFLAGCSSDYLPFSGGALDGQNSPPPADWSVAASVKVVQLETRATEPYSVNIWVVTAASQLYVFAGANRATWIEHIEQNPQVRLQMGDHIYALVATRVTDPQEFMGFARAWEAKYGNRPRNENVAETYLMRLRAPAAQ